MWSRWCAGALCLWSCARTVGERGADADVAADAASDAVSCDAACSRAVAVAAGLMHTCALLDDGSVSCWGYNDGGQLGDGTTTGSARPVETQGLREVRSLAAGDFHACAAVSTARAPRAARGRAPCAR